MSKSVSEVIKAVRGMNDVLPEQAMYMQQVEQACAQVAAQYGYHEIRFPVVEKTQLFKRCIGDATDIVEKEMYTFEDRNGDSLTLRPEGTAGCVRAGIEQGLLYNQIQRLWYLGPMFRHERPQKGRYRQFQQFGIESFGVASPDIDAEIILLSDRLWKLLGITDTVTLQLNTLGTLEERQDYRQALVAYFTKHKSELDDDSQRRLDTNPLRILDGKNPKTREIVENAPKLMDFIQGESRAHFDTLCKLLDATGIKYEINPYLVRGLDYYCLTVFEWVTDHLGAQGTICAGGRYDGLVEQLGGKATPAIGFAMGVERVALLLKELRAKEAVMDAYIVAVGDESVSTYAIKIAEQLRDQLPHLHVTLNAGSGSFKSQMKRADKSGAKLALIIGDQEQKDQVVTVKYLRADKAQHSCAIDALIKLFTESSL